MSKIIYVSGPMSGLPNENREAFFKAEQFLNAHGFVVLNPAVNPAGLTYQQYMTIDFAMLSVCNAIYMLTGHESSPGAKAELAYAHCCDFKVYYEGKLSTENVDN